MSTTILTHRYAKDDWRAWFAENASICESGTTEAEAIGKLVISWSDRFNVTIQDAMQYQQNTLTVTKR